MAKSEDGEFELILGNRQLLSVFFLVVVLLGLSFLMGYVVGKDSAPVLTAEQAPASGSVANVPVAERVVTPAPRDTEFAPVPAAPPPEPVQTASQTETEPAVVKAPPPKPEPVKAAAKSVKQPPVASAPVKGRTYLQLSATSKDEAEAMTDLLRSRGFTAIAAQIPEQPARYRVLVGPLADSDVARTRTELKSKSFPADDAIRRVF